MTDTSKHYEAAVAIVRELHGGTATAAKHLAELVEHVKALAEPGLAPPPVVVPPPGGPVLAPALPTTGVRPEDIAHAEDGVLRVGLRKLATAAQPGGISVLHLGEQAYGALGIGHLDTDIEWAGPLLRGRTLRIVGGPRSVIGGTVALGLYAGVGDVSGAKIELWGCTLRGSIQIVAPGAELTFYDGVRLVPFGSRA